MNTATEYRDLPVDRLTNPPPSVHCAEVAVRALAQYELQMHQPTGRVIDKDQQCAGITPVLEPTMVAAINLD